VDPAIVDHECLIAIVSVPGDSAVPDVIASELNHGLLVRYDNNVGQRNVAPVMSVPGGKQKVSLWARGGVEPTENVLVVDAGAMPTDTEISVRVPSRLLTGAGMDGFTVTEIGPNRSRLSVGGRTIGRLTGVGLDAADRVPLDLTIDFSHDAEHLHRYPLVFSQDQNGVPAGKETIEITAVKEVEDMFFGNARTLEVHVVTCQWWPQISSAHKVPFFALADAVARGYNGCRYCLPQADTG
jgi:zinc metalloprotease ZmpB